MIKLNFESHLQSHINSKIQENLRNAELLQVKVKEEVNIYDEPFHDQTVKGDHTSDKYDQCSQYDKAFTGKQKLEIHQRIHTGEKPYQCSLCNKTFKAKQEIKRHHMTHSGEKPYQCNICDKGFYKKKKS